MQGIRGNTGDYGNIGEPGPKVRSALLCPITFILWFGSQNALTEPLTHVFRGKKESKERKE